MLLSIIIPVYNGEKTLPALIESILKTDRKDIEIILVDDGSKDNSYSICKYYSERDYRVLSIHTENSGVSSARNKGLEAATGKYIYFCDCDDLVHFDSSGKTLRLLEEENYDMVMMGYCLNYCKESKKVPISVNVPQNELIDRKMIISLLIAPLVLYTGTNLVSLGTKFFLKDIIDKNNIKFDKNIYKGEDWKFILEFLYYSTEMYYLPDSYYEYFLDGSQQESKYKKLPGAHLLCFNKLKIRFATELGIPFDEDRLLIWLSEQINELIFSAKSELENKQWRIMATDSSVKEAAKKLVCLKKKDYFRLEISRKYRIYSFLILLGLTNLLRFIIKKTQK